MLQGPQCCSDYAVSFHYIPPNLMYVLEYLIYHVRPYGRHAKLALPTSHADVQSHDQLNTSRSPPAGLEGHSEVDHVPGDGTQSQSKEVKEILPDIVKDKRDQSYLLTNNIEQDKDESFVKNV